MLLNLKCDTCPRVAGRFFRLFVPFFIFCKFVIYVQGPGLRVGSGAYGTTGELAKKNQWKRRRRWGRG